MRAIFFVVVLALAFLLGSYVDHTYNWPFAWIGDWSLPTRASIGGNANVPPLPNYSPAQGAQDPPRSEMPEGTRVDMQRCINTMIQRREPEAEARQVCQKIISGISGGG